MDLEQSQTELNREKARLAASIGAEKVAAQLPETIQRGMAATALREQLRSDTESSLDRHLESAWKVYSDAREAMTVPSIPTLGIFSLSAAPGNPPWRDTDPDPYGPPRFDRAFLYAIYEGVYVSLFGRWPGAFPVNPAPVRHGAESWKDEEPEELTDYSPMPFPMPEDSLDYATLERVHEVWFRFTYLEKSEFGDMRDDSKSVFDYSPAHPKTGKPETFTAFVKRRVRNINSQLNTEQTIREGKATPIIEDFNERATSRGLDSFTANERRNHAGWESLPDVERLPARVIEALIEHLEVFRELYPELIYIALNWEAWEAPDHKGNPTQRAMTGAAISRIVKSGETREHANGMKTPVDPETINRVLGAFWQGSKDIGEQYIREERQRTGQPDPDAESLAREMRRVFNRLARTKNENHKRAPRRTREQELGWGTYRTKARAPLAGYDRESYADSFAAEMWTGSKDVPFDEPDAIIREGLDEDIDTHAPDIGDRLETEEGDEDLTLDDSEVSTIDENESEDSNEDEN
jgi:hypothetical protein